MRRTPQIKTGEAGARAASPGGPAVVFCMPQRGHFSRLRPLISGLAGAGVPTYVFSDPIFREHVERAGGRFVDLFAGRPIEGADATSIPMPCRYVSFAGHYAEDVSQEVAALRPAIVVHDTFALIATVVANHLALPRVNVCAGHNYVPAPTPEALRLPRVSISDECWRAVRVLRERHGLSEVTPFSYVSALSPDLNVYCEPPEFLRPEERAPFEPVAFFGSLSIKDIGGETISSSLFGADCGSRLRIYASFGTVVWRYYEAEALRALEVLSEAVSDMEGAVALVSLGDGGPTKHMARLARRNVRVESYADQWKALREASVYLTHQGLNSTHEAIFQETPMISYPFFADQPSLAARCQELGLAVPLVEVLRGPVGAGEVRSALARVATEREAMRARLAEARRWELETIRGRRAVIERIVGLMR
jgi:UDP:flavonoid glycosyltransferase YjiC (YdhE family)